LGKSEGKLEPGHAILIVVVLLLGAAPIIVRRQIVVRIVSVLILLVCARIYLDMAIGVAGRIATDERVETREWTDEFRDGVLGTMTAMDNLIPVVMAPALVLAILALVPFGWRETGSPTKGSRAASGSGPSAEPEASEP
jgi:hypothetical protein